ncbi:MAG TPA: Asp-tRNA(Asn)/Glu-tRNA(Gln) amidotransferase subunit GatB [Thermoanaerobaculia bacterium]|nr:Asp-tRNA(Asn)/Glu-tRNA(Gln) amidotransferase subunit GatB [Thermoanaerobaculia bacterium]
MSSKLAQMQYEAVVGLEVHVHLKTRTKIFCRCLNLFGAEPNTLVCPVCAGYPGSLPVLNREAVDLAVRLALALGCQVNPYSRFARKNYFYADLPKGYQISQYDEPVASGGALPLSQHAKTVAIHRLHLEEDAGKLLHETPGGGALPGQSLVDLNRCGVPLVEIVSAPQLHSPAEAQDYLQTLHQVLLYTGTSDGNMEEGSLRCDANVSVRPVGRSALGTKVEVKNLNSFRNLAKSIEYEIERQIGRLESGQDVIQETRTFDAALGVTRPMRGKEEAHDYRYFPEPDLPPLVLGAERVQSLVRSLPELPWERRARFQAEYGLSLDDARLLTSTPELAAYFEAAVRHHPGNPKAVANWVMTEVLRELKARRAEVAAALAPERLARLVSLVDEGALSGRGAKEVLAAIWDSGENPEAAMVRLGLAQVRDASEIADWVGTVLREHPEPVAQYLEGKTKALGYLVGEVMKRSSGRADPRQARASLLRALDRMQERPEEIASSR